MIKQIEHGTNLSEGINNAIREQHQYILNIIQENRDVHETIHEIRKSLKKLRAMVRLVRGLSDRYQIENIFFRDLGREISELRDKTALLESMDKLKVQYGDFLHKKTFQKFFGILKAERDAFHADVYQDHDPLALIEKNITEHLASFVDFEISTIEQITPGIGKVYKRGQKALAIVLETPETEQFHEWRKRTKYLRYQMEMLMLAWPHFISTFEETLHDLSDFLGDDHDLSILQNKCEEFRDHAFQNRNEYYLLKALIEHQRKLQQQKSIEMGHKVFAENPESFLHKIQELWEIKSN